MYPPYLPREGFTPPFIPPHGPRILGYGCVGRCVVGTHLVPSNVVVSVACVPFVSMEMLFNFGGFLIDFGTISGPFFYLQTMFKQCLFTLYVAYTQSVISNTPYTVLKVFHLRGSVEIQLKSVTLRA